MNKKIKYGQLIAAIAIPLAVGAAAALLTRDGMRMFDYVRKPPLSPPMWLFPVAWTALYILMGVASYLVYASDASRPRVERALTVYVLQLALNFLWPVIFFNLEAYMFAFIWLAALWLLVIVCAVLFGYIDRRAGWLLTPYILWLTFAAYLNMGVYLLN